jgi:hypothetical protein
LDKPLHVIYKASKLAYRILVILIANERVKKKYPRNTLPHEVSTYTYMFRITCSQNCDSQAQREGTVFADNLFP